MADSNSCPATLEPPSIRHFEEPPMSPASALPPLHGIRVADFSRVIAGPLCAMTLADLGADVVKIENPEGGDDTRGYRPPDYKGLSPAFVCYNRNKRSIALDLNKAEDLAKARSLTERADLVIENFRTGLKDRKSKRMNSSH